MSDLGGTMNENLRERLAAVLHETHWDIRDSGAPKPGSLNAAREQADAVLAVVGPELDRLRAEVDLPSALADQYNAELVRRMNAEAEVERLIDRALSAEEDAAHWRDALGSAEAERDDLRAQKQQLAEAITDLCWKATQYGETEDGDTFAYILPKGTVHRLIGAAQSAGIPAAFRLASVPEPSDSEPEQRCSQCGQGISDRACGPTHALLYAEQKKACEPAPGADREAGERS